MCLCVCAYTYAGVSKRDLRAQCVRGVQWGIKNRKKTINTMSFKSRTTLLHFKKALGTVHFSCGLIYICQRVILNFIHHIVPTEHQKHFTERQQAIESGLKPGAVSLRHSFFETTLA